MKRAERRNSNKKRKLPLRSACAALLGIQSQRQRNQDFSSSSPWPFIVAGLIAIAGVLIGLWGMVQLAMYSLT